MPVTIKRSAQNSNVYRAYRIMSNHREQIPRIGGEHNCLLIPNLFRIYSDYPMRHDLHQPACASLTQPGCPIRRFTAMCRAAGLRP